MAQETPIPGQTTQAKDSGLQAPVATAQQTDSMKMLPKEPFWGKPQRAALYSAIVPGMGQVYNQEYWKLPILYGGAGALGYFLVSHNRNYRRYDAAVTDLSKGKTNPYPQFNRDQLVLIRNFYRRNRDYSIILSSVLYLLQITDAHVFAHLKGFNINENLALQPAILPTGGGAPASGFTLTYQFTR